MLSGTGLEFSSPPAVVKAAIASLKQRQPATRVLLAVGGATYYNFADLNVQCIKDLVDDFGERMAACPFGCLLLPFGIAGCFAVLALLACSYHPYC